MQKHMRRNIPIPTNIKAEENERGGGERGASGEERKERRRERLHCCIAVNCVHLPLANFPVHFAFHFLERNKQANKL